MKSGIYLAALLYLFNNLGAGHGQNAEESINKSEGKVNFFSLDSNLKGNKKSKHNRVKRRNAKFSNFLNQKSYVKETDNENGKDVEGSHPSHDSSFVNLNDHVNGKSSSYSVHVRQSTPHSTTQRNNEKEKENEKAHGVVNSFVQSQEQKESNDLVETHKSIADISEKLKDDFEYNPVFAMEINFVDLHFFKRILDLIPEGSKYHEYYEKTLKQQVTEHTDKLKTLIDSCISEKEQIIILEHEINYAKTKSIGTETLGKKETELSEITGAYDTHIKEYRESLKPKINDIKNQAFSFLKDSYCKEKCEQYVERYNTMRRNFISSTGNYKMESYIYIQKAINDYRVIDKMLSEANALNVDIQESANSLKLLGKEINEISHLYKINSSLIDDAAHNLESIKEEKESDEIGAEKFENNSKFLAENYCIFEYIKELNGKIKEKYESKIKKSNELFSTVIDTLRKNATALYESTLDRRKWYKIKTDSDKIKDEAGKIFKRNKRLYDNIPDDETTSEKSKDLQELIDRMEQKYEYGIQDKWDFISSKYEHIYENLRQRYKMELNNIEEQENNTIKVNLYLQKISNINTDKTRRIDETFKKMEQFYKEMLESRSEISNLNIEFKENVARIKQLKGEKFSRALNEEEIKAMLEDMAKKADDLKKLVSLKGKSDVCFTEINELLNIASYDNMDGFSDKETVKKDINDLFNSMNTKNINELIEAVENFITENKETALERLDKAGLEQKLKAAKEAFAKLDFVSDDKLTDVYTEMSEKVTYAEGMKNKIAKKQFENVHNKMKEFSDSFFTKFHALQDRMKQYTQEGDTIKKHMQDRSEKEEEYFKNVKVDEDLPKKEINVQEYTKDEQNFSRERDKIFAEITHVVEVINKIDSQLNYYGVIEKYFPLISDKNEVSKVKALKEKIISNRLRDKIYQYEIEFRKQTSAVEDIVSNIQSLNRAINSLKRLNDSINNCNKYNEDIALFRDKVKTLREEIHKEITETERDKMVGENTKAFLLTSLTDKMRKLREELHDNRLNILEIKNENLLKFYSKSKSQIHLSKDQKGRQDPLNRIDEWKEIKKEVDELYVIYEMISQNKVTLFKNSSVSYIEAMHRDINNVVHSITSNKNEILKSVKAIEDKLNLVERNEDYKKVRNTENSEQIEAIRGSISKLNELVNKHIGAMTALEITSKSLKINAKEKENEDDLEGLNKVKGQMKDIYEKLKKISEELKKETGNELKEAQEKVDNVELEFEKKIIGHILEQITVEKDKAQKSVEEMNSLKNKIKNLINKTADESQNESITSSITKHLDNARRYENKIKQNEAESIDLRNIANKLEIFDEVKKMIQQANRNLQSAIEANAGISKELNELKGVKELFMSTNYRSILKYIKENSSESVRFSQLANQEFRKGESEEENARARLEEAQKLKEQIVNDLDYSHIADKVKKIEGIKREILRMKDSTLTFWEESEKYKQMCSSHWENTKQGKKKIENLENNGDGGKARIMNSQMDEVNGYVVRAENAFHEVVERVNKTEVLYKSLLDYGTKMENLFNESLMKEIKVKCQKKHADAEQIFSQIRSIDGRIKGRVTENQRKIEELKEKGKIEKKEFTQLNDIATRSLLEIDNFRKQLDIVLSNIERVKKNALQYFDAADKSMKSVLPISELNAEYSLNKIKAANGSYEKNLEIVKNEMSNINMAEGSLIDIEKKIIEIENNLLRTMGKYEEGLLQRIKENADKRKSNFELIRSEINALVDPRTSIFIKLKLKEYDMTGDLKNYGVKMNGIHEEFTKLYNLIETHLSNVSDYSVTFEKAQNLRERAKKEEKHLREREEEAMRLLNDIKKVESSKLLQKMMKKMRAEYEGMTRDHASVSKHVQDMKTIVDKLKTLNDLSECSSMVNNLVSIVKKVKESKDADYKREAKSMYESMVTLANYFLRDDAKISSGMEFNAEMKSNFTTDLESEIFSVVSNSNKLLKKIEEDSNDVIQKQRESEQLAKNASDIYNVIKLKNEFNEKWEEAKNKERVVSEKIREALKRLRQVVGKKCHFENFHTLLDNTEELANLKEMDPVYQVKKRDAPKESVLQEMNNDMSMYSNSIAQLEGILLSARESKEDTEKLERANVEMGNISEKISIIDSKVMEMNPSIDELYILGKNCESHSIFLIRRAVNMRTCKILRMITKQKENTEKSVDYIKTNLSSTDTYVETLKKFYHNKLTFSNASENVKNADKYFLNFEKHEKESLNTISNIKGELYSFHQNSDIHIVEGGVQNLLALYGKLKEEKKQMDNFYRNISETKLKQLEQSSDVFKPLLELHKRLNETNNKALLEKQKKLKSVEDNLHRIEAELIKNSLKYTPESVQNINNIYDVMEAEVKKLEEIDRDFSYNSQYVEEYKKQFSILIDKTYTLMNDIDIFKKENNYNLMEVSTEKIHRESDYIEKITNKLVETKTEYEKILENIKQNDDMLRNILLKKGSVIEFLENIKKKKEFILNDLYAQELLLKIAEKLDEIKHNVTDKLSSYKIHEKMQTMSKNLLEKKSKMMNDISIYDLEREAKEIDRDVKQIKDDAKILNSVLEDAINKRGDMDAFFNQISLDKNPSEYKSAEKHMKEASEIIHQLEVILRGIDQLVKDERILSEMNHKKSDIEKEKTIRTLGISEHNRKAEEEGVYGLDDAESTPPTDQTEMSDGTRSDEHDIPTQNTEDGIDQDMSDASDEADISNRKFNSDKVKYIGAFILLFSFGVIVVIMINQKDDPEEADIGKERKTKNGNEADEAFEITDNINLGNKEEIIDVCFVDPDE
ncbi:reticulocyte-binding protein 1 [Plasmodium inui San Antonio 1]|uniref:Reticulocyte-binding protein 1 n=1 Tax=Plasmodium inui San Antonio 1 TaxID=1237626 RepID=W7A9A8_9APIC|nr:reticulocyte-binding protein 1 [Plasmodium inui San Antonio 1]EUD67853.1 reticulocyte-binding protein 1 [Plasmodium inui San Antonio 1]